MGMQLDSLLVDEFRLSPPQKKALVKLGLLTIKDLLYHFPSRYHDQSPEKKIGELVKGEKVTVYGTVLSAETKKAFVRKIPMAEVTLEDETGKIKAIWFHQAYMAKKVPKGHRARITGTVGERKGVLYLANPELEPVSSVDSESLFSQDTDIEVDAEPQRLAVYPESRGITSLWFAYSIRKILSQGLADLLEDPLPEDILARYNLPSLQSAIIFIHTPKNDRDALAARKRFAFEEIFFIQLARGQVRASYKGHQGFAIDVGKDEVQAFVDRFPFKPTKAQDKAIKAIIKDLGRGEPMTRLLEGDVGSGKTAVAASTAYGVITTRPEKEDGVRQGFGNLQVAYMAPTEILARQHFESFIEYFKHLPINIGLLTGSECRKFPSKIDPEGSTKISRTQLLKWVSNGEVPILIGTHALIQKSVTFKHLAYVIIDEQHRFGTMQRAGLTRKDEQRVPHLLSMTATPIPRTLALTIYGDLDLTLLDEMPAGRKKIITEIVPAKDRSSIYTKIREELAAGRQAYVICPRIDEPDPSKAMALNVKSVKAEAKRLQDEIFSEYNVGLVHSKMKAADKEAVMNDFANGEIDILTATSVVEVGVNVPNATVIIIEGAERFGLSQLHQLRGRVLRSNHQAYCYLFSDSKAKSGTTAERLKALKTAKNGFELSELDLKLRGAGELSGARQWGISDLGMEAIKNIKMVEAARKEATTLIDKDPELNKYPKLRERLDEAPSTHFE